MCEFASDLQDLQEPEESNKFAHYSDCPLSGTLGPYVGNICKYNKKWYENKWVKI